MDYDEIDKLRVSRLDPKPARITPWLIERCTVKRRSSTELFEDFAVRITALNLGYKGLFKIENLRICQNLRVLYLYDNSIEKIEGIDSLTFLEMLYLQRNSISDIQQLRNPNLVRLNLDKNCISNLSGITSRLQDLSIANQTLSEGISFEISQTTCYALSLTLELLDVSGNCITNLSPILVCRRLKKFLFHDNNISEVHDAQKAARLPCIEEISMRNNPFLMLQKKNREKVLSTSSPTLVNMDGEVITAEVRRVCGLLEVHRHRIKVEGCSLDLANERIPVPKLRLLSDDGIEYDREITIFVERHQV